MELSRYGYCPSVGRLRVTLTGRFRRCEAEGGDDFYDRLPATTLAAFSRMSGEQRSGELVTQSLTLIGELAFGPFASGQAFKRQAVLPLSPFDRSE